MACTATEFDTAVSAAQLRDLLARASEGDVPIEERPLLDLLRGPVFTAYVQQWPRRRDVIEEFVRGVPATRAAAQMGVDPSDAREWVRKFLTVVIGYVSRLVDRDHDREILDSICSMTHGRGDKSKSGREKLPGATVCPGCAAR